MNWVPNAITIGRMLATPVVPVLALSTGTTWRYWACAAFVALALSDALDGYLARRLKVVSNLGKLLDPVADKLLMVATLLPIYAISHRGPPTELLPWWGGFPLWALLVILGREGLVTGFRLYSAKIGVVISADWTGKWKMLIQSIFCGAALLWYPLNLTATEEGWSSQLWIQIRGIGEAIVGVSLAAALVLTIYSMAHYLWSYRTLLGAKP